MRVHEFEGAMFEDEIKYYAHYLGWWTICGQVFVFFQGVIHGCYAFLWNVCVQGRDIAVTKRALGSRAGTFLMRLRKCFVFDVLWEVASQRPNEMGDVGREMVSWTITCRKNSVEKAAWLVNFGQPIGQVFLGGNKNPLLTLSIICWQCIYFMIVHVSLTVALGGLQVSGLYVFLSCRCVWILVRQSLVFIMKMPPHLSHSLMTMDQLF